MKDEMKENKKINIYYNINVSTMMPSFKICRIVS